MAKSYQPGELNHTELFDKLLRYCDYQERCAGDIRKKAKILGVATEREVNKLIRELTESGYLDEERFVKSFVKGKFNIKKWGLKRIERELHIRNLPEDLIQKGLSEIESENYELQFQMLAERKWETIKGKSLYDRKSKLFRFLYNKGYESDLINAFMRKLV